MSDNTKVSSIILAGGQGSRLLPLTKTKSKPAVPVGGRYWLIDIPISESLKAQFSEIFIITQNFSEQIKKHVKYQYSANNQQKMHFLAPPKEGELSFHGTADAVRKNLSTCLRSEADFFCILAGDQIYSIDFMQMVHIAQQRKAPLVIGATPVAPKCATRMGLLQTDSFQKITRFVEKPQEEDILQQMVHFPNTEKPYLASMGIYLFRRDFLEHMMHQKGDDFGFHLIPQAIEEGDVYEYTHQGYWEDIGTITSYHQANILMAQGKSVSFAEHSCAFHWVGNTAPSYIDSNTHLTHTLLGDGVQIEAQSICNSVIGSHCKVGKNSVIEHSILLSPHHPNDSPIVGKNSQLQQVILDEGTSIGDNVCLRNYQNTTHFDSESILVRDKIIIVPKGTHIPHNFSF